jgi:tRNA-modifying protein YgfZ
MHLSNREVLVIRGNGAAGFLQKMVTQDIKLGMDYSYSLLLSPIGRYLSDFFIFSSEFSSDDSSGNFFIDIDKEDSERFISILNKYKFRADFEIEKTDLSVHFFTLSSSISLSSEDFIKKSPDPRALEMGFRCISNISNNDELRTEKPSCEEYDLLRIVHCLPEREDFTPERTIPIEYNMKEINGIAFGKGCYIGQEFTNRSYNSGVIRKKLARIIISEQTEPLSARPTYELTFCDGKPVNLMMEGEEAINFKSTREITSSSPIDSIREIIQDNTKWICLGITKVELIGQTVTAGGYCIRIL